MSKKWYKREICFDTPQEREIFDNTMKNLKNKTGENSGKIVMGVVMNFKFNQNKKELLTRYTQHLYDCGYLDDDWWCEEPTSVDSFLEEDKE